MANTFTIKELADICNTSVPTITKHVNKLVLNNTLKSQGGKKVKAVIVSDSELETLKENIGNNKVDVTYIEKYLQAKEELINLKAEVKLIEDKSNNEKAIYINEINTLKKENAQLETDLTTEKNIYKSSNALKMRIIYVLSGLFLISTTALITILARL